MSSSRSIAAARQKRAGEQSSQPMNNSRPITSISSQGAFAQQQMMSQNIAVNGKNVRVAQNRAQNSRSASNMQQQQPEQTTKISISNAIGLVTLRLGRLENYISEMVEDGKFNNNNNNDDGNGGNPSIPSNMKLVSDEVFENIVNRLNLLESKIIQSTSQTDNLNKDVADIKKAINNFNAVLASFINETNEKFMDYEAALAEIEQKIEINADMNVDNNETNANDVSLENQQYNEPDETNENSENNETNEPNETNENN